LKCNRDFNTVFNIYTDFKRLVEMHRRGPTVSALSPASPCLRPLPAAARCGSVPVVASLLRGLPPRRSSSATCNRGFNRALETQQGFQQGA
jgi:hypothetical protein